jgi:long-chain acyl-CoA synthetase
VSGSNVFPWLAAYPEGVRPNLEYPNQPLTAFFDQTVAEFPDKTAIIYYGRPFTYATLAVKVDKLAAALHAHGVGCGDRVAIMLPNCPQFVVSFFAVLRLGAVVVPVNPLNAERELVEQLKYAGCNVLLCLDTQFYKVGNVLDDANLSLCIVTGLYDYMPKLASYMFRRRKKGQGRLPEMKYDERLVRFEAMIDRGNLPVTQAPLTPQDDLAVLQYTGGTSGITKAAMLTHHNIVANLLQIREWFVSIEEEKEVFLGTLPFTHIFGLTAVMNYAVMLGATLVILPRFRADKVLHLIKRYGVTIFPGTPTMFAALNALLPQKQGQLPTLKLCISGAAALNGKMAADFMLRSGSDLVEGYGLSEASPVTHCNPLTEKRKPGSVGVPLPDTECKIVDLETGERELPAGSGWGAFN